MIRKPFELFLIVLTIQTIVQQGSFGSFCNVYLLDTEFAVYDSGPYTGTGSNAGTTYTKTDIPELETETTFTVSFYFVNQGDSNDWITYPSALLFQLTDSTPDSNSNRWLQVYHTISTLFTIHQIDGGAVPSVNHQVSPDYPPPLGGFWIFIHVEFDAAAQQIYIFYTDFSTFTYEKTETGSGVTNVPMGSNGKLIFGCIPNSNNMQCASGKISRPIFAPFSRKVTPYDTLAYMFKVKNVVWYKFDNTDTPGEAKDYSENTGGDIEAPQPDFPSYTLGQEDKGLSFVSTKRVTFPDAMPYRSYQYPWQAVETFVFWLNMPLQTLNPAHLFTRYEYIPPSTYTKKFQISFDNTNTVRIAIGTNSYSTSLTIPVSTWTLLIVALKVQHVSVFVPPSGHWQQTFPTNQWYLHSSGDFEYLGSQSASFTGYLREMRIFSDSSLVNFGPNADYATCQSGCTYGIGFPTLKNNLPDPVCLYSSTPPTCASGTSLFSDTNACFKCYKDCDSCTGLTATNCEPCSASQNLFKLSTGYCGSTCPTASYGDTSTRSCEDCVAGCDACTNGATCTTCTSPKYLSQIDNLCYDSCPTGTYVNGAECSACPSNCDVCSSGTVCTTCSSGFYLSSVNNKCYNPCPAGTYLSGSTCSGCSTGCSTCTSSTACTACQSGYYLYDDGSTQSCYNPCPSTLVADTTTNTCTASCPAGTYLDSGVCEECVEYCTSCSSATSCDSCSGGRVFADGACVLPKSCAASNCTLSFNLRLTSDPLGFILIFNQEVQAILDSLSTTLVVRMGTVTYFSSDYYLQVIDSASAKIKFPSDHEISSTATLTCELSLPYSLSKNFTTVHDSASITVNRYIPLSPTQETLAAATSEAVSVGGDVTSTLLVVSQLSALSSTSMLFAAFGSDMIQMYRFVNVRYPEICLVVFNDSIASPVSISLPISMETFESAGEAISINSIISDDASLERHEVNRYFINNFCEGIFSVLGCLLVCGIVAFARRYRKKMHRRIVWVVDKAYGFLCWNFTISILFSYSVKLYFYSIVYLWYIDSETANGIINLIAAIITIVVSLGLLAFSVRFLRKAKREELAEPERYGLSEKFKCFYEGVKHGSVGQKYYVPMSVARAMIFGTFLSTMRYRPLPQIIMFCIMNTAFFVYLLAVRASEETAEMLGQIASEAIVCAFSFSVLALAVIDPDDPANDNMRSQLGMAIVLMNFILLGVQLLVGLWGGFQCLKALINVIKKCRKRRLSVAPLKDETSHRENASLFGDALGLVDLASPHEPLSRPTIEMGTSSKSLEPENITNPKPPGLYDGAMQISPLTPIKLRKFTRVREGTLLVESPDTSNIDYSSGRSPLLKRALERASGIHKSSWDGSPTPDLLGTRISMGTINFSVKEENEAEGAKD